MRRGLKIATVVAAISTLGLAPAAGAIQQRTAVSGTSPFGPDCNTQPQTGTLYLNSEVEPWLDVDPTSADDTDGPDFIGVFQQDRYSDGGARGLGASVSTNGAASFSVLPANQLPRFTQCAGNQLYERASDPWVSFAPNGDAYQISLSFNNTANPRQRGSGQQVVGAQRWSAVERSDHAQARHEPGRFQRQGVHHSGPEQRELCVRGLGSAGVSE